MCVWCACLCVDVYVSVGGWCYMHEGIKIHSIQLLQSNVRLDTIPSGEILSLWFPPPSLLPEWHLGSEGGFCAFQEAEQRVQVARCCVLPSQVFQSMFQDVLGAAGTRGWCPWLASSVVWPRADGASGCNCTRVAPSSESLQYLPPHPNAICPVPWPGYGVMLFPHQGPQSLPVACPSPSAPFMKSTNEARIGAVGGGGQLYPFCAKKIWPFKNRRELWINSIPVLLSGSRRTDRCFQGVHRMGDFLLFAEPVSVGARASRTERHLILERKMVLQRKQEFCGQINLDCNPG